MSLEQALQGQLGGAAQQCEPALQGVLSLQTGAVARLVKWTCGALRSAFLQLALSQAGHLVICCRSHLGHLTKVVLPGQLHSSVGRTCRCNGCCLQPHLLSRHIGTEESCCR